MPTHITPLLTSGAWKVDNNVLSDARGDFHECFHTKKLQDATGHDVHVRQANISRSHRGTLRGIKVTTTAHGQAKYVTCVRGAVVDVVVDLRVGSPTFGQWHREHLTEHDSTSLYIGEGIGHAFLSLVDGSTVTYLLSHIHDPQHELTINARDPDLAIPWPDNMDVTLSSADATAPGLHEAQQAGLLPMYVDHGPRGTTVAATTDA